MPLVRQCFVKSLSIFYDDLPIDTWTNDRRYTTWSHRVSPGSLSEYVLSTFAAFLCSIFCVTAIIKQ